MLVKRSSLGQRHLPNAQLQLSHPYQRQQQRSHAAHGAYDEEKTTRVLVGYENTSSIAALVNTLTQPKYHTKRTITHTWKSMSYA